MMALVFFEIVFFKISGSIFPLESTSIIIGFAPASNTAVPVAVAVKEGGRARHHCFAGLARDVAELVLVLADRARLAQRTHAGRARGADAQRGGGVAQEGVDAGA